MHLGVLWYCDRHYLKVPDIVGVEVEDEETGQWSFALLFYGFVWKTFTTWSTHFASSSQMAQLLQALSQSKAIFYPRLDKLYVRNIPEAYAAEFSLPFQTGFAGSEWPARIRLPVEPGRAFESKKVHWVGPNVLDSVLRA